MTQNNTNNPPNQTPSTPEMPVSQAPGRGQGIPGWNLAVPANEIWNPRASDRHGHSANMSTKVPPQVAKLVQVIVQRNVFGYEDISDLLRHALLRHLHWLNALEPTPKTPMGVLFNMERILATEEIKERFDQYLPRLNEMVQGLLAQGTHEARSKALSIVLKQLNEASMLDDRYYRQYYTTKIQRQHADLLGEVNLTNPAVLGDEEGEE